MEGNLSCSVVFYGRLRRMTPTDETTTTGHGHTDGCGGEHDPATNLDCEMGPALPRGGRRPALKAVTVSSSEGEDQGPTATVDRAFDPAAIALEATERGENPLSAVVGQYGGYLSACWENLAGAGVFESTRAAAAAAAAEAWLAKRELAPVRDIHIHGEQPGAVTLEAGDRLLLVSPSGNLDVDQARETVAELKAVIAGGEHTVTVMTGFHAVVVKAGATL